MSAEVKKFYDVASGAIRFRNFSGKAGMYNTEGDRNFCLLLTPEDADEMIQEGYNVRFLRPRDEADEPQPYIQIKVGFGGKGRPPKIVMISNGKKTQVTEDTVSNLDWAEIEKADISINPYTYSNVGPGKASGVKAYLKTMYVTLAQDDFEDRYVDIPDSAQSIEFSDDI